MIDENWIKIVEEYEPLIGRKYKCKNEIYTFEGLLHGKDDYYYVLYHPTKPDIYMTCVGALDKENGFELLDKN